MSKKLLLADDSITIQKVIQITFAHEDYELTITDNGDAALLKAKEIRPDLVMSDVYMPGKNGYELTSAIRQDPELKHIPVLLLAGSFEPFDEDKARSCQANAWIEKPFESQTLIDKVAELLSAAPAAPSAPVAEVTPPVFEPEPLADVELEDTPLPAFDEPAAAEPEMATASEDPFGDISFDEAPELKPEPVAEALDLADDWSDVAAEPEVEAPVVEDVFATAAAPVAPMVEDFSFEDDTIADDSAPVAEVSVADADLDVFEMGDDEIMPLDDDDILGAEDLEPALPEQTLASWSRTEAEEAEDLFGEPLEELPGIEEQPVFEAPVFVEEPSFEEPSVFEESAEEESVAFEEPVAEPMVAVAPVAVEEQPAAVAPVLDVEAKVSAISENEIEQIIERVVTKVVEKLAGSILERVAWEVVPDLAENMIREEIRKIKDAAA